MELSDRQTHPYIPILAGKFPGQKDAAAATAHTHRHRPPAPGRKGLTCERRLLLLIRRTRFVRGQAESDVFARVVAAADRDDDVLLAVDRIGHRRAALRRRHPDLADLRTGLLVVRMEHRTARPSRRG